MKYFIAFIMGLFISFGAMAQNTSTLADVKSDMISKLQKDGYLSDKMAKEASLKYISAKDSQTRILMTDGKINPETAKAETNVNWTQYLSFINFLKVVGIILLLIAFSGYLRMLIVGCWFLIAAVPVIIYQAVFLSATVFGTLYPDMIWASQYFYIALFCSFANLMILGWIAATYPKLQAVLEKLFSFGIPVSTVLSFWAMIYFGALALGYHSSIFGFFAAVALSGIFSFTLIYTPGTLFLYFKENALAALVFGHLVVLGAYVVVYHLGIASEHIQYFNAGLQYYCSIALGVGLLVGASPFYKPKQAVGYAMLFLLVFAASIVLYFFLGMTTIATVIMVFFTLFFIEWIGYIGFKGGLLFGCIMSGGLLYTASLVLENYGPLIMTNLKAALG